MNKKVRNLDIEKILFFDAETIRRNKSINIDSKEFELYAWSLRDRTTGFIPPSIEVSKHYEKNGALKPEFNKIVCVSVGYIKDSILYYKSIVGTQKEIVETFYNIVNSTGFKVCGHNIIKFDGPVLRIKAFEEGIDLDIIPDSMMDSGKRPWNMDNMIDTMELITGTYYTNISLDSACMLKGIKSSKDDISGAYVSQVYYEEGVERIAKYCNKDVIATAELFCSLVGKSGIITEYVDKGEEELKEKEPINVFSHILSSGQLNKTIIDTIVKKVEEDKLNANETLVLVTAALSNNKENNKVLPEDIEELKSALGLLVDYSKIQIVVDKTNLGKKEANELIKEHIKSTKKVKKEILDLIEQFLIEMGKFGQKRAKEAFDYLKSEWKL